MRNFNQYSLYFSIKTLFLFCGKDMLDIRYTMERYTTLNESNF